jgi:hypothetical protein
MGCCNGCETGTGCAGTAEAEAPPAPAVDFAVPVPSPVPGTTELASRLALADSEITASFPISIEGSNAVRVDIIIFNLTLSAVTFRVQVSNDNECWSNAAEFRWSSIGYTTTKVRGIGFRFVRLFYEASNTASGKCVLAASIHHWRN